MLQQSPPDIIVRGEGSWIWDIDGHRLVDGVAGLWTVNLGFGRAEIREAIIAQLDELAYYNVFRGTTHPRAIELAERVIGMMQPDGVAAVFFSNGGSDAVEGAMKLARQYWKIKGEADRTKFISLRAAPTPARAAAAISGTGLPPGCRSRRSPVWGTWS